MVTEYVASLSGNAHWENGANTTWTSGKMIQGDNIAAGDPERLAYYGVAFFPFEDIRNLNLTNRLVSARIEIVTSGYWTVNDIRLYVGSGLTSLSGNARPSELSDYISTSSTPNSTSVWTTASQWMNSLLDPNATCLYVYNDNNPIQNFWIGQGYNDATPPRLILTWQSRLPSLTNPGVPSTATITANTFTHAWTASMDTNGSVSQSQISYEYQISTNAGSSWGAASTTAAGTASATINYRTYLALQATQYFYNTTMRIRVRAKATYSGTVYYSAWVSSGNFTLNYRIVPTAPTALSASKTNPYQGETTTLTMNRPSVYNGYNESGNVMQLTYRVRLANGTVLAAITVPATQASIVIAYTVEDIFTNMMDLNTSITAFVTDEQGQVGASSASVDMVFLRFSKPVLSIDLPPQNRTETTMTININVLDTGFGGFQSNTQLGQVYYSLSESPWTIAPIGTWKGLDNKFIIMGLKINERYSIGIHILNIPPDNTDLSEKQSETYYTTILEFSPAHFVYRDSNTGVSGSATNSLIVGADYLFPIDNGDLYVQNRAINILPVGTIYTNIIDKNPNEYFGGKWTLLGTTNIPKISIGQTEITTAYVWLCMETFPAGFTAEYFDAQNFTAKSFDLKYFTAHSFDHIIRIEV